MPTFCACRPTRIALCAVLRIPLGFVLALVVSVCGSVARPPLAVAQPVTLRLAPMQPCTRVGDAPRGYTRFQLQAIRSSTPHGRADTLTVVETGGVCRPGAPVDPIDPATDGLDAVDLRAVAVYDTSHTVVAIRPIEAHVSTVFEVLVTDLTTRERRSGGEIDPHTLAESDAVVFAAHPVTGQIIVALPFAADATGRSVSARHPDPRPPGLYVITLHRDALHRDALHDRWCRSSFIDLQPLTADEQLDGAAIRAAGRPTSATLQRDDGALIYRVVGSGGTYKARIPVEH